MIYGVARQTRDIDIVINLKNNDVDSFLNIFSNDFYLNRDAIKKDISDGIMFNVISETTSYKIDFAIKKNTEFHEAEFLRKKEMKFF